MQEIRQAVRSLIRAPRFTCACVITLGLALAGASTLLTVLEAVVLRRMAVPQPERLVGLYPAIGELSAGFSAAALDELRARQRVLTDVCGVTAGYGTLSIQFESGTARQRPVEAVTGACYAVLGVRAALGRLIGPDDDSRAGPPNAVAVISERTWRREFEASPDVIGRTLRLEGTPLTIVGVLPGGYHGVNADEAPDVALPLALVWALGLQPPRAMHAVGRLRDDVSVDTAAAALVRTWPEIVAHADGFQAAPSTPDLRVVPLASGFSALRERHAAALGALVALAACLLLLAGASVAGLWLARLLERRHVFAVQLALGAGRWRLAAQLGSEAVLIGAAAALLATPIAWWGGQMVAQALWPGDRPLTLQATPLVTTFVITVGAALLVSGLVALPGWLILARRRDVAVSCAARARPGFLRGLLAAQSALCFVLAFCAALFASSLTAVRQLPLGYDPARLQWVRLDSVSRSAFAPTIGYADALLARLDGMPGVSGAALSQAGFGTTGQLLDTVVITSADGTRGVDALGDRLSPGFFAASGVRLLQGRDFTWQDVGDRATVAIVNHVLADRLFPDGDALGRILQVGRQGQVVSIIGIAAAATPGDPRIQNQPQYYLPLGDVAPPAPALLVRLEDGPITNAALRQMIEPAGIHYVLRASTMEAQIARLLARERLIAWAAALFAAIAGVAGITGLYAALSQEVTRRRREIGIRGAVGATPARIRRLVLAEACRVLVPGLIAGFPLALAAYHASRPLLSAGTADPAGLLATTGLFMLVIALAIAGWPAHRAARIPIADTLRIEG